MAEKLISKSFVKRIRDLLQKEKDEAGTLAKAKTLPADLQSINATSALLLKSFFLGLDHATEKKSFAEDEQVEVLPFEEAINYLLSKNTVSKEKYYSYSDKLRFRAFTVSRIADGDILKLIQKFLAENLESGDALQGFLQKTDTEIIQKLGLGGNGWYWETVYRTNTQTAYNVGRAVGFDSVKPLALELVGIGDDRQTEICRSLTQPPVRKKYGDEFWKNHWPPFHFNCRTTVRAIYDEEESKEEPLTRGNPETEKPEKGFGSYPLENDSWWKELKSMKKRAVAYGVQKEIAQVQKALVKEVPKGVKEGKAFYVNKEIPVDTKDSGKWIIDPNSYVTKVKSIIAGQNIRDVKDLRNDNKLPNGKLTEVKDWHKMRGTGVIVNTKTGKKKKVELHWYQCKGIGKIKFKEKTWD